MKILVVDDDELVRFLLAETFCATRSHEVVLAEDAKTAIEKISEPEVTFDFFLVDIQMPQVDGVELTKMIRKTPGYALAPIVMLTAMQDRGHVDRAFEAGATDYITKPFEHMDLQQRVQAAQALALRNRNGVVAGLRPSDHVSAIARNRDTPDNPLVLGRNRLFLGYGEFENYVLQFTRRNLSGAYIYSVGITNLAAFASRSEPDAFARSLGAVTKLIQEFFARHGGLGSYRGKGTFLFVTPRKARLPREAMEAEINTSAEGIFPYLGDATPRIVIGEPTRLDTSSEAGAFATLRDAVEEVESRKIPQEVTRSIAGRLLRNRWVSEEQRNLAQQSYRSVLQSVMSEELLDSWPQEAEQRRR